MTIREHDVEPVHGLHAELPEGERILWQGSPDTVQMAIHAFHVRAVTGYFALLALWRLIATLQDGASLADAGLAALWLALPAALAIGVLSLLAGAFARTTIYTITNERIVLRFGLALTMTVNVPYALIEGVALRSQGDGTGDLVLNVNRRERISWLLLWPNVRPWRYRRPEPMLRAIPEVSLVASLLSRELRRSAGVDAATPAGIPDSQMPAPAPALATS